MTQKNKGTRYVGLGVPVDDEMTEADVEDFDLEEEEDGSYNPDKDYSKKELEELADTLLRDDADRELCRQCKEDSPSTLPYGEETGEVAWLIQYDKDGVTPLLDDEGNTLYVGFPELQCANGHRWYKGEGPRRDIRGPNPILFETHLYNRKRREIQVKDGVPDPAYTMDRWGKRPVQGMYYRVHPNGRKQNTNEQRKRNGASFTGSYPLKRIARVGLKPRLSFISTGVLDRLKVETHASL